MAAERNVLVTGGAGFIGSSLVRHLIERTSDVVVNVDCLTYAGTEGSLADVADSPRFSWERVDIRDMESVRRVFREHRPDAVVHLAAESHVDRSIDGPVAFIQTNLVGTFNVLEAARESWSRMADDEGSGRRRFLHVSTDEVFGGLGATGSFGVESPYRPNSPYAASKAGADHLARAWHRTFGLPVIVTNCSNNFGPYQFPEKFIPHMIVSALEDRELPIYGDGSNVRDWLFVEDHVDGLVRALDTGRPGDVYLFGEAVERTNLEVVEALCGILDEVRPRSDGRSHGDHIAFVPDRPGHDHRYAIDTAHAHEALGWSPAVSFEQGLARTVEWYLEREDWWRPLRRGRYRGERLGELP